MDLLFDRDRYRIDREGIVYARSFGDYPFGGWQPVHTFMGEPVRLSGPFGSPPSLSRGPSGPIQAYSGPDSPDFGPGDVPLFRIG
jgi:hypothetical protein